MPRFAWRAVSVVAGSVAVLLLATITRYGYHRDELYFRMLGEHPAWGYVDQPPATPLIVRAAMEVFGDSVWAIRLPAVLCVVGMAFVAALVAREFGGRAGAQGLAALGAASGFPLIVGHVLLTATLDLVVWAAFVLFAVRALRRTEPRWCRDVVGHASTEGCSTGPGSARRMTSVPAQHATAAFDVRRSC